MFIHSIYMVIIRHVSEVTQKFLKIQVRGATRNKYSCHFAMILLGPARRYFHHFIFKNFRNKASSFTRTVLRATASLGTRTCQSVFHANMRLNHCVIIFNLNVKLFRGKVSENIKLQMNMTSCWSSISRTSYR